MAFVHAHPRRSLRSAVLFLAIIISFQSCPLLDSNPFRSLYHHVSHRCRGKDNAMRRKFRFFLFIAALGIGLPLSSAQAQDPHEWITRELDAAHYKLSSYEDN